MIDKDDGLYSKITNVSRSGACTVWRVTGGEFKSNAYLLVTEDCSLLIDGGLDVAAVKSLIELRSGKVDAVLLTHGHFDHVASAAMCQKEYNADVFLHADDFSTMKSSNFLMMACGMKARIKIPSPSLISDRLFFSVNGVDVKYHHVPGHTPGSCLVEVKDYIFSGDTIYSRGIGKTGFRSEDFNQMKKSLNAKREVYTAAKRICPGHGGYVEGSSLLAKNTELRDFLSTGNC